MTGLNGSVFQMFAHGIMTGLFFALVGLVYEKAHSREIFKMGGFATMMPGIATAFTIGGLSSLGLPATAGFVAEFLTFLGAWSSDVPLVAVPGGDRRVPHVDLRAARRARRSSGDRGATTRTSSTCPTRTAPSGPRSAFWCSCSCSSASRPAWRSGRSTRRRCRSSNAWSVQRRWR